jgi:hypothetical protein
MNDTAKLTAPQYRLLVAIRYLNASSALFAGMQSTNDLHFLVTLRSFIEYTRRGIWFLAWAKERKLKHAEKLTFQQGGSPDLVAMDMMLNEAIGNGKVCYLKQVVPLVNEPFLDCLHALTHGNPISVRMLGIGLQKIFQKDKLLLRAQMELNWFDILVCRRALGEPLEVIWKLLGPISNQPDAVKQNAKIAALQVKKAGGLDTALAQLKS